MSLSSIMLDSEVYTYEYFLQEDICRFCWSKNADHNILLNSEDNSSDEKNELLIKVREILDIDMAEENSYNFPKKACINCFQKIENFYDFKKFCEETNKKLCEILKNHTSKTEIYVNSGVKLENGEFPDLGKTESFESFLESLQNSDEEYVLVEHKKVKKKAKTSKYKPKRSSTYCNICCMDLETTEKFRLHNSESHGVENNGQFKCFGCEKRFKNRKARLGHEIKFCKGLKDGYKCSICHRFLPKRRMYEAHMRDHRDKTTVELAEDIFKCIKCLKLFKTKESLKSHMLEHENGKKTFFCECCGRVFARQDYLHKHKLTHSGLKQHVCPHCDFRTTQRSSLTVHIRKHTGERPYSCDMCPQRCVSSSNLRAHRRRHLGLKQYECKLCSKKFGYKISLEEHIASTHECSQSYPCHHCGAIYTRRRGLQRHLLAKHGQKSDKLVQCEQDAKQSELNLRQSELNLGQCEPNLGQSEQNVGQSEQSLQQGPDNILGQNSEVSLFLKLNSQKQIIIKMK